MRLGRFAAAVVLALTTSACGPDLDPVRPNVVLISIDSLRADHLGCYGYDRPTSPMIDRLAAEGTVFEVATSSSSWTLPAHASLFTGLPDSVHGCDRGDRTLVPERRTLAEAMQAAGYDTAGVWSGPLLDPGFGLAQGFEAWMSHSENAASARGSVEVWERANATAHEEITSPRILERAQAWLDAWSLAPDRRPFFLFLHMWDPHYDYIPPPPYDSMFDADYSGTEDGRHLADYVALRRRPSQRDLDHVIALYDGEVAWTDRHVGQLMEKLGELEVADETVVVLTADHGEEFFEHGRFGHKRELFDESIRIPLIIRFPGRIPAGSRRSEPVQIADIAPTILELSGAEPLPDVMGRSLVPLLDGTADAARESFTVSELAQGADGDDSLLAVRTSGFKILARPARGMTIGLWNLRTDPLELTNVFKSDTELTAKARRSLRAALGSLDQLRARHSATSVRTELPEVLRRELESLGYLESASNATSKSAASLYADPNPVVVCEAAGLGKTSLKWNAPRAVAPLEIRVESPDGPLMASVGLSGSVPTGEWVHGGMGFFLVEAETDAVLATTTVAVTRSGCAGT